MQHGQLFILSACLPVESGKVIDIKAPLSTFFEFLIGFQSRIQFFQNATIVDEQTKLLLFMQAVNTCNSLNKVVISQWLVNVKYRIAGFIKAGKQLIYNNEELRVIFFCKSAHNFLCIGFIILVANIILPPLLQFRQLALINLNMTFTGIRW